MSSCPSATNLIPQLNYQYNYNYGSTYGPDDAQHRQLHRIWETGPEGELLINRSHVSSPSALSADPSSTAPRHMFLDIYLPNDLLLPIQCPAQRTLALLKQDVFIQARKYPLSNRLEDVNNYIFSAIGLDGTRIELYDEQVAVSSLQFLFLPLLVLIEPDSNKEERELNQNIGLVMGVTLSEVERSMNEEMHQYRLKLFQTCVKADAQRGTQSFGHYAFPEEPLLHHDTSDIFQGEEDPDHQTYSHEKPIDVEKRAMEKLRQKMQFFDAYVEVWFSPIENPKTKEQFKYSVRIRNVLEINVEAVVSAALRELRANYGMEIPQQASDFILQIAGRRVFITRRDVYLTQFDYIRSCFENYRIPRLILRQKKVVFLDYPPPPKIFEPSYVRRERHNQYLKSESKQTGSDENVPSAAQKEKVKPFWDLDENFKVRINSASNVTVQDNADRLFIRVAVAVGRHILDVKDSAMVAPSNPRWCQEAFIDFDVYMKDLPESTQLCFTLLSVQQTGSVSSSDQQKNGSGGKKGGSNPTSNTSGSKQLQPLGWANLRVFDWRTRLIQGKHTLYLKPFEKDQNSKANSTNSDPLLQFFHFEDCYGNSDSTSISTIRTPRLEIEMPEFFGQSFVIEYPPDSVIQRYIVWLKQHKRNSKEDDQWEDEGSLYDDTYRRMHKLSMRNDPDFNRLCELQRCLDSSSLVKEDQHFLWHSRYKICREFPQMLPVLADCPLIWCDRETTSEFYHLLSLWPSLRVDTAIELLDGRYVDRRLRAMAVEHLNSALDDDQLQLYLLILVQAIRFEPHAFSPLMRMLLTRSLMDYRVGHTLFWLLRAELAHLMAADQSQQQPQFGSINLGPSLSPLFVRFALLLEAYCRGNTAHLKSMIKQVEMISILTSLSATIHSIGNKEAATKRLQQELAMRKEKMYNMVSPVNATDRLGDIIVEECRVLGSAKHPLFLTWKNPEILAELTAPTHQLIFKCGDDMRQDMLSLHVMRIMDAKWKCQLQQDYCMTLYEVLPMGRNIGLIHVVPECQTLFQIQCEAKRTASLNMDVALINKYIYKKCCASDSKKYLECVDRFTFSLAGYCVATYILGIKDRHQDNIMLARDGRIFHIDFGHFLGHTKRKLGINRERTDFILTDHFLYVISRGKTNFRQTYEYNSFREKCIEGFLVLHKQARFFIALFRMMCCMGLPELNCPANVDFLRHSLMYDKIGQDDPREAFERVFDDVAKADWSIQLNWFFHSVRHM